MIIVHVDEEFDIYGGRGGDWGNYAQEGLWPQDTLKNHFLWLPKGTIAAAKVELVGKRVACWCKPKQCHLENLAHYVGGIVERPVEKTIWGTLVTDRFGPGELGEDVTIVSYADFQGADGLVLWDGKRPDGALGVLVI